MVGINDETFEAFSIGIGFMQSKGNVKNDEIMYTPANPKFYYMKVGFEGF